MGSSDSYIREIIQEVQVITIDIIEWRALPISRRNMLCNLGLTVNQTNRSFWKKKRSSKVKIVIPPNWSRESKELLLLSFGKETKVNKYPSVKGKYEVQEPLNFMELFQEEGK